MNRTTEASASLEHAPGAQTLTDDELTKLSNNLRLRAEVREVFRTELALRRLQQAIGSQTAPERVFEVQCRGCPNTFQVRLSLIKGVKLPADFPFLCKECVRLESIVESIVRSVMGEQEREQEKGKETSRRWREEHKEEAAEYKRRYREGVGYVPMSDAEWNAVLEQFGYACSTPGCGQPLTRETAMRSRQDGTRVPICRPCLCRKAANEKKRVARYKPPAV